MKEPKYRLFLFKNGPAEEGSKRPYFTLKLITEDDDWRPIGAFWKAASGKGYSGFLEEGVELDVSGHLTYKEKQERKERADQAYDGLDD